MLSQSKSNRFLAFYCCLTIALTLLLGTFFSPSSFSTLTDLDQPAMASQWTDGFEFKWSEETLSGYTVTLRKTTFGTFPQSYVGDTLNETLNSYPFSKDALEDGTAPTVYLAETGKEYDVVAKLKEYCVSRYSSVGGWTTESDRYVQVGDAWFKVEPIEWIDVLDRFNENSIKTVITSKILYTCNFANINGTTAYADSTLKETLSNFLDEIDCYVWKDEVFQNTSNGYAYIPSSNDIMINWQYFSSRNVGAGIDPGANQYMTRQASATDFADALHDRYYSLNTSYTSGAETAAWWTSTASFGLRGAIDVTDPTGSSSSAGISSDCGVRPALDVDTGTTQNTYSTFDDAVSTDSSDPDIYRVGRYEYHIKSFYGLRLLSSYTNYLVNSGDPINEIYGAMKFYLDNNIDCGGKTMQAIKNFYGTFDGQCHAIYNLNIYGEYSGFIGEAMGAVIKNLYLLDVNIEGSVCGGVIGKALHRMPADVIASTADDKCVVSRVYFEGGKINATSFAGGFVGACGGSTASIIGRGGVSSTSNIAPSVCIYECGFRAAIVSDVSYPFVAFGISDSVKVSSLSLTNPTTTAYFLQGAAYIENSYVDGTSYEYACNNTFSVTFVNAWHAAHGRPVYWPDGTVVGEALLCYVYEWSESDEYNDLWVRRASGTLINEGSVKLEYPILRWMHLGSDETVQSRDVLLDGMRKGGFYIEELTEDQLKDRNWTVPEVGRFFPPGTLKPVDPPSIRPTG